MTMKRSWSGILIVILSVGLVRPARADNGEKVLIVIAATTIAAAISVVAIVAGVHHRRKKITITGCVIPGENGMTVTDEEDSKTYALTGDTKDIKPGERMRLEGKKLKPQGPGKASVWEAKGVIQDFGYCQPQLTTPQSIAVAPSGKYVYVANENDNEVSIYTLNSDRYDWNNTVIGGEHSAGPVLFDNQV